MASRASVARATARSAIHPSAVDLASKHIEAVDNVKHRVAVDAVVFGVAALHCADGATEIALVVEYIIELQHDGERLAFEEAQIGRASCRERV